MQWRWLQDHVRKPKDSLYAQRVLERYRMGMKARGAIRGVQVIVGDDSCPICRQYAGAVYHPDDAPIIPITGCTQQGGCRCAYRAVMDYEEAENPR